jgi:hypothetical protein
MVAWLITMVPGIEEHVVTILNYRLSSKSVGAIMEQLYVDQRMGLESRLEYAKTGKGSCPTRISLVDGIPYGEELWCGSGDRYFWARKVDNLCTTTDEQGNVKLTWTERKRPDFSEIRELLGQPALEAPAVSRAAEQNAAADRGNRI